MSEPSQFRNLGEITKRRTSEVYKKTVVSNLTKGYLKTKTLLRSTHLFNVLNVVLRIYKWESKRFSIIKLYKRNNKGDRHISLPIVMKRLNKVSFDVCNKGKWVL